MDNYLERSGSNQTVRLNILYNHIMIHTRTVNSSYSVNIKKTIVREV